MKKSARRGKSEMAPIEERLNLRAGQLRWFGKMNQHQRQANAPLHNVEHFKVAVDKKGDGLFSSI